MIDGHKWFTTNGSIADFLIVMAVTDPDAQRYQRASMFIVPADTPGVTIVRDVPTMEHPFERGDAYGGHAEIRYEDVRVGSDALLGARGAGFLIAQQRLGPGRIHHCMRWLGVVPARVRHALRARRQPLGPRLRCWPTSRRSRTGSPTRPPRCRRRG